MKGYEITLIILKELTEDEATEFLNNAVDSIEEEVGVENVLGIGREIILDE